eukprot:Gregarina_sp_Poly_1__3440@NODE_19_length_21533_cov_161_091167_g17_i0_p17_GENE_NODE_19_length_21533_cov_161_091167_g17_i0NODE_19_length_21533_cov_161_091167_g17_i0_p17_ORF_typecomplete_len111_score12_07_NODE_19_length_21533_cov_161_091167_g17_i01273913071
MTKGYAVLNKGRKSRAKAEAVSTLVLAASSSLTPGGGLAVNTQNAGSADDRLRAEMVELDEEILSKMLDAFNGHSCGHSVSSLGLYLLEIQKVHVAIIILKFTLAVVKIG